MSLWRTTVVVIRITLYDGAMNYEQLPVYQQRDRILDTLSSHQVVVVESPTGSGKTTQLPLILHRAGYSGRGMIGVTQPRRIAALSVCEYISSQMETPVGGLAGYKMRFEDVTDPGQTRIKIMTDGILLQELKADPLLSQYSVIMVDEAHERSLNIDFILGLLKRILDERPDFKVVISSATINPRVFSDYFGQCPIVHIDTEPFPVQVIYDAPETTDPEVIVNKTTQIVERVIREKKGGDVLIFQSGERMIKDTVSSLYNSEFSKKLFILPLYGRLSKEEQERVFIPTPAGKTKVVVSTNIAETSVTIDGITTVIDPGYAKINYYNPRTFTSSLVEEPIARASSNQRKGRAGRTQPGRCYRLYPKQDFDARPLYPQEEIYRTDLSEVALRMAELGIKDIEGFDFLSSPGQQGIQGAIRTLELLQAIDTRRNLTSIGRMMVRFPLLPYHSRMIVDAVMHKPEVLEDVIIAAAFLSARTPFLLPPGEEMEARKAHHTFQDPHGDFVSYIKILRSYRASQDQEKFCERRYLDPKIMSEIQSITAQLEEITGEFGIPITGGGSPEDYLCSVAAGLIQFVCIRSGRGMYKSLTTDRILIHPGSVMFRENPDYIVAGEIVRTSRMYARSVSPLKKEWLTTISPQLAEELTAKGTKGGKGGRKDTRKDKNSNRDSSQDFYLGGEVFPVEIGKGNGKKKKKKKTVVFEWTRLKGVLGKMKPSAIPDFHNLRGKVLFQGGVLLEGTQVNKILRIMKLIDPDKSYLEKWPRGQNSSIDGKAADILFQELPNLGRICWMSAKKTKLGFLSLQSDGRGTYWFKSTRSFSTTLEQSLSSLELLADELDDERHGENSKTVGRIYRYLGDLFDSI